MDRLVTMSFPGAGGGALLKNHQIYSRLATVILNVRWLLSLCGFLLESVFWKKKFPINIIIFSEEEAWFNWSCYPLGTGYTGFRPGSRQYSYSPTVLGRVGLDHECEAHAGTFSPRGQTNMRKLRLSLPNLRKIFNIVKFRSAYILERTLFQTTKGRSAHYY